MSKRTILILIAILAVISALVVGFFVWQNVSEKPAETIQQTEVMPESSQVSNTPVLSGMFVDGDSLHSGTGTARISMSSEGPVLTFSEDFKVTNGPDLFVYLSPNAPGEGLGDFASLERLKSTTEAQAYNAPADYTKYKSVVIWCRAFNVTFATAELTQQ